jgi:hypothetical protein
MGRAVLTGLPLPADDRSESIAVECGGGQERGIVADFVAGRPGLGSLCDALAPHRQHLPTAAPADLFRGHGQALEPARSSRPWPLSHPSCRSGGKSLLGQEVFGAFQDATWVAF